MAAEIASKVSFDKIYSSDLVRAMSTAELVLPGCKYETSAMLREVNVGNIAGKPLNVIVDSNNRTMNKNGYSRFGGESKAEFKARTQAFMKMLESEPYENVAVFAHAGVLRNFLDIVLGVELPRKNIRCNNCAIAIFEYADSNWRLYSWINLH